MADEPKKDSIDSRKEILDLLKDLQAHYGTYHNHKETVGWAGVALFAALMVGVATILARLPQAGISCDARVGMSLAVVGACLVCTLYVYKQFALRKRAADLLAACVQLRGQIVGSPSTVLTPADWAPPTRTDPGGPFSGMQSTYVLPNAVTASADKLSSAGQTSRRLLENCAYAILFSLSLALLVTIWTVG